MPDHPRPSAVDTSIPFYDRTPEMRATRACLVKFVDSIGTHLICARKTCRRERRCADRDMRALPFCWERHRGMLRFLLQVAARRVGADTAGRDGPEEADLPGAFTGEPLLTRWQARGAPIEARERSGEDGPDDWTWEAMPEMVEEFRRLTER